MKYESIDPNLYIKNRLRFEKEMTTNSLAVFSSNPTLSENGDAVYDYKANSDLVWLSGIVQEKTFLVIYPDNADKSAREVLFIQKPDELLEKWHGHLLRKEEARKISGIENIQYIEDFEAMFKVWMHHADIAYLNTNENDRLGIGVLRTDLLFIEKMKQEYPLHQYRRAAKIMKNVRAIKTPEEIEIVQKAIDITHKAFLRVMKFLKPGVKEYEVEAEITHEFLSSRATRHAYSPIIASGKNACILHYVDNNRTCEDGALLLMDFGAEYGNYNADLSRTIPVNGKFTERQKEVYNACLNVHRYCASILKPGMNYAEYVEKVNKEMENQLIGLGLFTREDVNNQDPENPLFRNYFYHGIGHHIGMDVHDIGTRNEPVKAGMLFTVEPGIYIAEEDIGIRIENEYWLTENGNIDLFEGVPITVEEIEAAMTK